MSAAAITWPWLRRIRIEFANLLRGKSRVIEADGTRRNYHILANVSKDVRNIGTVSSLWIWNLNSESRASFVRDETTVRILAGWDHGPFAGLREVFSGTILFTEVRRAGPDIVTQLHVQAGRRAAATTNITRSWSRGVPIATVVEGIARAMESVEVDARHIRGITAAVGESGLPISSDAETALNELARTYGFYWSIDDGLFTTIARDPKVNGGVISHAGTIEAPYLISASPVLTGVRRVQTGVDASCVFNPMIRPGHGLAIKSTIATQANGDWRVQKVHHALSTFNDNSFTTQFSGLGRR